MPSFEFVTLPPVVKMSFRFCEPVLPMPSDQPVVAGSPWLTIV